MIQMTATYTAFFRCAPLRRISVRFYFCLLSFCTTKSIPSSVSAKMQKTQPLSPLSAKFSAPFSSAAKKLKPPSPDDSLSASFSHALILSKNLISIPPPFGRLISLILFSFIRLIFDRTSSSDKNKRDTASLTLPKARVSKPFLIFFSVFFVIFLPFTKSRF